MLTLFISFMHGFVGVPQLPFVNPHPAFAIQHPNTNPNYLGQPPIGDSASKRIFLEPLKPYTADPQPNSGSRGTSMSLMNFADRQLAASTFFAPQNSIQQQTNQSQLARERNMQHFPLKPSSSQPSTTASKVTPNNLATNRQGTKEQSIATLKAIPEVSAAAKKCITKTARQELGSGPYTLDDLEIMQEYLYDLFMESTILIENHASESTKTQFFIDAGYPRFQPDSITDLTNRVINMRRTISFDVNQGMVEKDTQGNNTSNPKLSAIPTRPCGQESHDREIPEKIKLDAAQNIEFMHMIASFDYLVGILADLRLKVEGPTVFNYVCFTKNKWIGNQPNEGQTGWKDNTMAESKAIKLTSPAPVGMYIPMECSSQIITPTFF
jgi:hypothetical protein